MRQSPFILTIILFVSNSYSWPWLPEQGTYQLLVATNYYKADEKFSDGTVGSGGDIRKGDRIRIFVDTEEGELISKTTDLEARISPWSFLQLSYYQQYAVITWDKVEGDHKKGFSDIHLNANWKPVSSIPALIYAGATLPTAEATINSFKISLGQGTTIYHLGTSFGWKVRDYLILYTSQQWNIPAPRTTTFNRIHYSQSWQGNASALLVWKKWGFNNSMEWRVAGNRRIESNFGSDELPDYAYLNLRTGLDYPIGPFKVMGSILKPLKGIEVPTAVRYQLGISYSNQFGFLKKLRSSKMKHSGVSYE